MAPRAEGLRSHGTAIRILRLAAVLRNIPGAERIADQIERSGPSIALNYAEAQAASSKAHFITIIETSEREARETQAALEIIIDQEYVKPSRLTSLYQESSAIVAISRCFGDAMETHGDAVTLWSVERTAEG